MTMLRASDAVAPISEGSIARFAGHVFDGVLARWRNYNA